MTEIVLALCNLTPTALIPWRDAGYRCVAVDLQHEPGIEIKDGIEYVGADVLDYLPPLGVYKFAMAFPPCTDMAVSGARWFKDKGLYGLAGSLKIVQRCLSIVEWTGAPYFIENPVSTLSTYWRKPDYTFDPCDYGDPYTKKTCLWTNCEFIMPERCPVDPILGSKMHLLPPSKDRANLRSATPEGFSRKVFEANNISGVI